MTDQPNYQPAPATMTPSEERTWGMVAHIIGLVTCLTTVGFLGFVGSLITYLVFKDRGPFVRAHAANALNIQITTFIVIVVGWIFTVTIIGALIGIPLLILGYIGVVIIHAICAVKAQQGEFWDPPLTITFVR